MRYSQLHSNHTRVQWALFPEIGAKELLPQLTARLQAYHEDARKLHVPVFQNIVPKEDTEDISHSWFWPRLGQFFREKDVVVAETGAELLRNPELVRS